MDRIGADIRSEQFAGSVLNTTSEVCGDGDRCSVLAQPGGARLEHKTMSTKSPAVHSRRALLVAVLVILVAAISACTRGSENASWGTLHEMTIARINDPVSLNPLFESAQPDIDLAQLYAEPLVGLSSSNALVPVVARRVPTVENGDISRDGRTISYHLRHDERFADGVALTSADVAFTYRAIMDPANPVAEVQPYRIIERLDTPGPFTVVLHLRRPWGAAVAALFAESDYIYGILPAHAFASTNLAHAAWNEHPFGSGPFRVVQWRRGDEIVLEPNPYARRKPHLLRLILKIVPDRNTQLLLLRTHAVDVMDYVADFQTVQLRSLSGLRPVRTEKNSTAYLAFNTQRPPTNDIRIRRALLEAIDRPAIAAKFYNRNWPLATTEIPAILWAHDPSIQPNAFDPSRAARELNAAGWKLRGDGRVKEGRALVVQLAYLEGGTRTGAAVVQANLARVGVQAVLHEYPANVFFSLPDGISSGGRFNLAWTGFSGGSDPEQSEIWTCDRRAPNGPNVQRWCDPRYDRLFAEQSRRSGRSSRRMLLSAMQRIVRDAVLFVPLVYRGNFSAENPGVRGWNPNMLFEFSNSEDWDVVP